MARKKDPSLGGRKVSVAGMFLSLRIFPCPFVGVLHVTTRGHRLGALFTLSLVKTDIWITSAAPHPSLGVSVQPLYVAGVWGS